MNGNAVLLFAFILDGRRFALKLEAVERVIPSVEITPLPGAPDIVLGLIDIEGAVVPVVDIRARFRLPEREMGVEDRIIVARTGRRTVGILVDAAGEVIEAHESDVKRNAAVPSADGTIEGVLRMDEGIVLIHDLERFLSIGEEGALSSALDRQGAQT